MSEQPLPPRCGRPSRLGPTSAVATPGDEALVDPGRPSPGELEDRILPWSQVKVISGLSRTTVWRLQKTGDFPSSVQVSMNRVGWRQSDLLDWKKSRMPRRLPEPRHVPDATEKQGAVPASPAAPRVVAADPPAARAAAVQPTVRRRRKRHECEHQTAFDF